MNQNLLKFHDIQLAGVVAIEMTGRANHRLCSRKTGAPHLRAIFYRMGLSDKDIVALSGSHTLEGLILKGQDLKVPGQANPSNLITLILWKQHKLEETEGLLKLPADEALLGDPEFRHYVEMYAKDEDLFFKDYAESHKKLSELGFTPRDTDSATKTIANSAVLAQSAFGVAVAAAVVILSYRYEVTRRK
ncbi:probable L-ascorbate peroxidase 4, peroxisomal [Musa acuminata AAA Group]|uniref:probable L-ascorbate peroxidase 4, peroxisomal n=1 Tax=Musa acuminata AAA Group TaxID=214697 RepID=UPI0031DDDD7E